MLLFGVSNFYKITPRKGGQQHRKNKTDWEEEFFFNIHENMWDECLRNVHTCSVNTRQFDSVQGNSQA